MADLGNKIKQKQNFNVKIKKINNKQKVKKIGLNFWCCENYLKYNLFKLLIKKQCKQLVNIIKKSSFKAAIFNFYTNNNISSSSYYYNNNSKNNSRKITAVKATRTTSLTATTTTSKLTTTTTIRKQL